MLTALTANHADLLDRMEAGDAAGYFDHLDPGDLLELESLLDTYFAAQAQVVQMVEDGSADDAVSRFTQELLGQGKPWTAWYSRSLPPKSWLGRKC